MKDASSSNEQMKAETAGFQVNREKYWKELNEKEKMERVRTLLKSIVNDYSRVNSQIDEIRDMLWNHAHEENGNVVIKISKEQAHRLRQGYNTLPGQSIGMLSKAQESDEVYI